eukprot:gb/GECG01000785.1/.p1 GENE.gb/GECG01000785.1/~~gb/GECG01000785.1/.p1  ORF type:complete len:121 (+),score=13.57 gb/GECG01000785.1/:1-363(+)
MTSATPVRMHVACEIGTVLVFVAKLSTFLFRCFTEQDVFDDSKQEPPRESTLQYYACPGSYRTYVYVLDATYEYGHYGPSFLAANMADTLEYVSVVLIVKVDAFAGCNLRKDVQTGVLTL